MRVVNFFRSLSVTNRIFYALAIAIVFFVSSFFVSVFFAVAQTILVLIGVLVLTELVLLYQPAARLQAIRGMHKIWSLGDENSVAIELKNSSSQNFHIRLIDEIPEQFQDRKFHFDFTLKGKETKQIHYVLRPVMRGIYSFGNINLMITSVIGLVRRRIVVNAEEIISVYPSVIQMKKYELIALARISTQEGIKKLRRLGHSYEFEEIKNYVRGDDYRSINWKSSGRRNQLMVNEYEDERSQQIYSIIDRSRSMRMPFNGMSLLDYAVNTSLVISNIALLKSDKAGLITFADKFQTFIKADRSKQQLSKILEALYAQREETLEANYELMYQAARNFVQGRSLLFLYSNFESIHALARAMPILRKINHQHLLVVIIFINKELEDFSKQHSTSLEEIYDQTIAQKFMADKEQLVVELRRYGIQCILTRPEDLSINTVNKYLEFKSRGLI